MSAVTAATPAPAEVLLTAEGRFFSVGGDIRAFTKDLSQLPRIVKAWTADVHMAIVRFQRPIHAGTHDGAGAAVDRNDRGDAHDVLRAVDPGSGQVQARGKVTPRWPWYLPLRSL